MAALLLLLLLLLYCCTTGGRWLVSLAEATRADSGCKQQTVRATFPVLFHATVQRYKAPCKADTSAQVSMYMKLVSLQRQRRACMYVL